jgi:hypothetical protein
MARFGGNEFTDFSVPLVFAGRYFILEPATPRPLITVFLERDGKPVFEVLKNEPQEFRTWRLSGRSNRGFITR